MELSDSNAVGPPSPAADASHENEEKLISCIRFLISNAAAGSVIGKGGATITEFQAQSGARIQLSRNHEYFPGTNDRVIALTGTIDEILEAFNRILTKLYSEAADELDLKANQVTLVVPHSVCGAIIGKGGTTIRSFVEESHANIKLSPPEHTIPGLRDRLVTITGTFAQQMHAVALITRKISEDANYAQYASAPLLYTGKNMLGMQRFLQPFPSSSMITYGVPSYGFYGASGHGKGQLAPYVGAPVPVPLPAGSSTSPMGESVMMAVPDERIGIIVGRGGKTISDIQQISGVRIKISDRGDFVPGTNDRKVIITGSPDCIYLAQQLLSQKIHQI